MFKFSVHTGVISPRGSGNVLIYCTAMNTRVPFQADRTYYAAGLVGRHSMRAMVLSAPATPLRMQKRDDPIPGDGEIRIRISACGVCRTDLHIIDGELKSPKLPLIPGHEVIATVVKVGDGVRHFKEGDSVGVPWLAYTCGKCNNCLSGRENLCINSCLCC